MPAWIKGGARFLFVTAGIIVLTSFTIDATDMLKGSQSALGILADRATGDCPQGMVVVDGADGRFCIDAYEASVGTACPVSQPAAAVQTAQNLNSSNCVPQSVAGASPWVYVAKHQADALCARAGKRLPTATEWYMAALGTPDNDGCNISGKLSDTGTPTCRSGAGAYDMIGNVWETVNSVVKDGTLDGVVVAEEGYITGISGTGIPTDSASSPDPIFNSDYVWTNPEGEYAVMRGGYYGGDSDAGIYTFHAKIDLNFSSPAIGFRCAATI